jgi:arylsulfatase
MQNQRSPRLLAALIVTAALAVLLAPVPAHAQKKPNILVIWGDDIGVGNISAYHRGLMGGRTPTPC